MQFQRKNNLNVVVENREKILYEGPAWAVSSKNDKGTFDILSGHSNFITLVKDFVVVHTETGEQKFTFKDGALWITKDIIKVCLAISPQAKPVVRRQ